MSVKGYFLGVLDCFAICSFINPGCMKLLPSKLYFWPTMFWILLKFSYYCLIWSILVLVVGPSILGFCTGYL